MQQFELANHTYAYQPGQSSSQGVFVLLHGTGGDEVSMLTIGNLIDPTAHKIGIRGNIQENGLYRYFKRHRDGVYDLEDLGRRTQELASAIPQILQQHQLDGQPLTIIGYSNGANIAISLLLNHPSLANQYILFRPLFPYKPGKPIHLPPADVLLLPGQDDPLAHEDQNITLANMLNQFGAKVTTKYIAASHGLTDQDLEIAQNWRKLLKPGNADSSTSTTPSK